MEKWKDYKIIKTLGKGTQGKVREALHLPTGTRCAIKTIKKDETSLTVAQRESGILRRIHHPHIIRLLDEFETKHSWALVFELFVVCGFLTNDGKGRKVETCLIALPRVVILPNRMRPCVWPPL
jgi:hypothetical protein